MVEVPDQSLKALTRNRKVAAIYQYLDKNGELVAEKVRYTNKTFFWRSKKPDGSYDYHKPENVPLYNGMVLEKAEAIFLVEGEKDVDTLTKHGLPAVSLPNGAIGKMSMPHTFPTR